MGMKEDAGVFTTKVYIQLLKLYEQRGGGILQSLYDTIPIAMFFMLPLFAILLKLFYLRRGTFAHHIVFSFYFFTFIFTTFCVLILANTILDIPTWIEGARLFVIHYLFNAGLTYLLRKPLARSIFQGQFYFLFVYVDRSAPGCGRCGLCFLYVVLKATAVGHDAPYVIYRGLLNVHYMDSILLRSISARS